MATAGRNGSDDRRASRRHIACFPAYVDLPEDEEARIALIRNVSIDGALLLTRGEYQVGTKLDLALYLSGDPDTEAHPVSAEVVRSGQREVDRADLWPYSAAVKLDSPLSDLEPEIEKLAERQAGMFGPL